MFPAVIHDFKVQMGLLKSSHQSLNILAGGKASECINAPWRQNTCHFLEEILYPPYIETCRGKSCTIWSLHTVPTWMERSLYIRMLLKGPLCLVAGGPSAQTVTTNKLNPSKSSCVMINEQLKRLLRGYVDVQEAVWAKLCPHISDTRGQVGTE